MKAQLHSLAAAVAMLVATTAPVWAHHPFAAQYDSTKPVTLTGTIDKFEWTNPHSFVYINGKDETGKGGTWKVELGSPKALTDRGWSRDMLKKGEQVTIEGWLARDGSQSANAKSVKFDTGKTLSAASSYDGGHPKAKTHTTSH
jgi:hypothetical protein